MRKKIMILGAGELGKEFAIACQRLGQYLVAVDNYDDAPAMHVAQEKEVINMLDAKSLDAIVAKHKPDIIVPEIEAIRTDRFYYYEKKGIHVVPSAKAANYTMNRKAIRDLAAKQLDIKTVSYCYADSLEQLKECVKKCCMPCVVKPLMSSSGKGQSIIKTESDIEKAWNYALDESRGDLMEVIVEEFINFDYEITLLTLSQENGNTLFCPPIGHRQVRGDYHESWQPMAMKAQHLIQAQEMAKKIISSLGGSGIWGVEFFIRKDEVYFSELSPRPHDTGMVTLGNTQNFSQFELHARAVLGIPVKEITLEKHGASAVVLATNSSSRKPTYEGLNIAATYQNSDFKIFGKPITRPNRRMAVTLAFGNENTDKLVEKAKKIAAHIKVIS